MAGLFYHRRGQRQSQPRRSPTHAYSGIARSIITRFPSSFRLHSQRSAISPITNHIDLTIEETPAAVVGFVENDREEIQNTQEYDKLIPSSPSMEDIAIHDTDLFQSSDAFDDSGACCDTSFFRAGHHEDRMMDDNDDDDNHESLAATTNDVRARLYPHPANLKILADRVVIDLVNGDIEDEVSEIQYLEIHDDEPGVDELLAHQVHQLSQKGDAYSQACANSIQFVPFFSVNTRTKCAPGKGVQLRDGTFVHIELTYTANNQNFIVGKHLIPEKQMKKFMPDRPKELIWTITRDTQQAVHSASVTRPASDVVCNREIIFTNQLFPTASFQTDSKSVGARSHYRPLFCRWKRTVVLTGKRLDEERFESLRPSEADDGFRRNRVGERYTPSVSDRELRIQWRGGPISAGGSHTKLTERCVIDVDGDTDQAYQIVNQTYTFGDSFCGAGGTSMGAVLAGLQPEWAFDMDNEASTTYRINFYKYGAAVFPMAVHEFIQSGRGSYVDILHISPPCQPFSPAHTIPSPERDELNQAAIFSIHHLVETVKPRIVTVEQTHGLQQRHGDWFAAVINIFVSLNYSVGFKVIRCQEYGVPQTRTRLVIMAAGPGERLPSFPEASHGTRQRPFTTINDAIATIPGRAANHDTNIRFRDGPKSPFIGNIQAKTLTCSGGVGNYHPSGLRPYTLREIASLQTFPRDFSFAGAQTQTATKRQIGNAVPPVLAKAIFEAVIASLKETDGVDDRN